MLKSTAIRSIRVSKLPCLSFCQRTPRSHVIIPSWSIRKNQCPFTVNSTRHFSTSLRRYFPEQQTEASKNKPTMRENIYTIPNLLTTSRILACPVLGWSILDGNYHLATGLLVYAGLTDLVRRDLVLEVNPIDFLSRLTGIWRVVLRCRRSLELFLILQPTRR
jgi:cardiolipin synthase